ncbi:MAG: chromosomal replication initiator protein DnaA [Candidatus Nealsonbacteria bacterium]|nr:chromosomal replication initiator protein DnaA [Candidatus Nealsonbacteria bacterium]
MTKEELWQAVLAQIQFNISKANFATWFRNTEILEEKEGKLLVSVPNAFSKEWLEQKYNKFVLKTLHDLNEGIKEVEYIINRTGGQVEKQKKYFSTPQSVPQLEFEELKVSKETNLNPKYTFENFIVGPFNEMAQAAGWAISENPGAIYNPLFVYGGVGLGKTHLIQAIGNKISENFPDKKIKYASSEKFITGIVGAIKNGSIESFKQENQKIDVLIIDDIQFLAGKEKTQEEFFHLFNALYEKNKQIVLSSDRFPKAIPALEERLRSRFEGGMIADIGHPDYETRLAILKIKSKQKEVEFSDKVLEFIASNVQTNIREIEGALNRLIACQRLNGKIPDLETAKNLLKNIIKAPPRVISSDQLIKAVADFYNLKEEDILNNSRRKEIVRPRQVVMYLLREELKCSFPTIGRKLGGKDHTTIIYGCEKIAKESEKNEVLVEEIKLIKQKICSG